MAIEPSLYGVRRAAAAVGCCFLVLGAAAARAECVYDVLPNPLPPFDGDTLYPNWTRAPTAEFTITAGDRTNYCASGPITGITIFNYGTASGGPTGDIRGVYFKLTCGGTNPATMTMTYAGLYSDGAVTHPAWTWGGSIPFSSDPCGNLGAPDNGCLCNVDLQLFTDISPCPVVPDAFGDAPTVELGPGYHETMSGTTLIQTGGIRDDGAVCGCMAPWGPVSDPAIKSIRYVKKSVNRDTASPGDVLTYTIFWSDPGTSPLNWVTIMDTIPSYMHVVPGSANPPADPGFDPDPGPPTRLRWTFASPTGPQTRAITFQATIDWGNGEAFEPGSGDLGAPEGAFLSNAAAMSWDPPAACNRSGQITNAVTTVVQRYLFWKVGDQDMLFAAKPGMPDDEIIYDLFVRNVSAARTWWNVRIWDTVPAEIDAWAVNMGMEDPCLGWTMTPSGCAAGSPGKVVGGGNTILTWTMDLPPGGTGTLRWKGKLRSTIAGGVKVRNLASIRAFGASRQVGGSGDAANERSFTHQAEVVLRTTYVSYVGWAAGDSGLSDCPTPWTTYFISFFPLNKAADFALYKKWCGQDALSDGACAAFATSGGVSPSIDEFAGTCTGGPAINWEMGCKVERAPARFAPSVLLGGVAPASPFNWLHKMVSNAPVVWELDTCFSHSGSDADTYIGSSSLTFAGYVHYTTARREESNTTPQQDDVLHIVNTDDGKPTSVYVFVWDVTTLSWSFVRNQDLYDGSHWSYEPGIPGSPAVPWQHVRVLSSNTPLIVHKAFEGISIGGSYNDLGTQAPNRENGGLVSGTVPATFYLYAGNLSYNDVAVVGCVSNGGGTATYEIWKYKPDDPTAPNPNTLNTSADLVGFKGAWSMLSGGETVNCLLAPGAAQVNPRVYGNNYTNSYFSPRLALYKVVLTSGGPVQTYCGRAIIDSYSGGNMMHASLPAGQQTGYEYWINDYQHAHDCKADAYAFTTVNIYCPVDGEVVQMASGTSGGAVWGPMSYTTNGVDQCVSFRANTPVNAPSTRNWRVTVPSQNAVMAQFIACHITEKFYTAPFLQKNKYYSIIAPPVVYTGQAFWLTIVVIGPTNTTLTTYTGITSFSSTDPLARLQGQAMDSYNYAWTGAGAGKDNGVHVFIQVTLTALGFQTIIASDILDGSITGLTTIQVVGADIKLTKEPPLQVAASGDTVQFRICWSNYSTATGASFTITDAVPDGTVYVPDTPSNHYCGATKGFGAATVAYSTTTDTPAAYATLTGPPSTAVQYLKWTIPQVGVATTGCVCFRVTVQ